MIAETAGFPDRFPRFSWILLNSAILQLTEADQTHGKLQTPSAKRIPAPWPTPIYKLSMTYMVWNISNTSMTNILLLLNPKHSGYWEENLSQSKQVCIVIMKNTESILTNRYIQLLFICRPFQKKKGWPGLDQEASSPIPQSLLCSPHTTLGMWLKSPLWRWKAKEWPNIHQFLWVVWFFKRFLPVSK